MEVLIAFYILCNIPLGAIGITIVSFSNAKYNCDVLFFPILTAALREKLNKTGTGIVLVLFSIFFAPALTMHFMLLIVLGISGLIVRGFVFIFKRKDI